MAFPLKSGADLYNQQLIRAAIWNYSAEILDPKEYVTGLMYFNTNSGSNLYQKLRFRTGTAWKTIAFEEDLDVANNAEFKALEDKVKLLAGEVDTDAIISNMKEVSNFLAGFAEDANLMSMLDDKLSKTNGGTIRGSVAISGNEVTNAPLNIVTPSMGYTGYIRFGANFTTSELGYLGFSAKGVPAMVYEEKVNTLLHSGNVGEYAFTPRAQITSNTDADTLLTNGVYLNATGNGSGNSNFPCSYSILISAAQENIYAAQISIASNFMHVRRKINTWSDWKTIAFTDSNVASATKLETPRTIWGQSFDGTGDVSGNLNLNLAKLIWHGDENYSISCPNTATAAILQYAAFDGHLFKSSAGQVMLINSSGNVTIGGSDLAGTDAKLYVNGGAAFVGGRVRIPVNGDRITFNADSGNAMGILAMNVNNTYLEAPINDAGDKAPIFIGWRDGNYAMTILKTGNVGIGTMTNISSLLTLAASTTEEPTIAVDDHCKILGISNKKNDWGSRTILESGWNSTTGDYLYLRLPSSMANSSYLFMQRENGGRFGVDTNAPQAKFHVAGDIVANGTIACKGIAAEGDAMDMVDKTVLYIIPNGTQQTFTLNHGLGTREITISIYEITSMGTNMILTDVEIVDDNNISVSFGNPPTDNHMVVVMG